ncbi:MAG: hypothetical protein ACOYLR_06215 [Chlorobium sp.]
MVINKHIVSAFAPVALFGYDRSDHFKQTIERLQANELADRTAVYVFSDNAKNSEAEAGVQEVRKLVKGITGFESVTIIERDTNWGLLRSMIDGVAQVSQKHGQVIVLEDDIITNPYFLCYMNKALDFYKDIKTVGSISGYVPDYIVKKSRLNQNDTFFHYRTNCWGWATWGDRWVHVDWAADNWQYYFQSKAMRTLLSRGGSDLPGMLRNSMEGKNQSWMARWYYHCFLHGMLTLYPARSLVDNIGFDGSGVHSATIKSKSINNVFLRYRTPLQLSKKVEYKFSFPVYVDRRIHNAVKKFWDQSWFFNSSVANLLRPIYRKISFLYEQR